MNSNSTVAYDKWHEQMDASSLDLDPLTFPWYQSVFEGISNDLKGDLLEVGCGQGDFARLAGRLCS